MTDIAKPGWLWGDAPAEAARPASGAILCPEVAPGREAGADEGGIMPLKFAPSADTGANAGADAGADVKDCGFANASPVFNVDAGLGTGTTVVNNWGPVDCESAAALNPFASDKSEAIGNELPKADKVFVTDLLRGLASDNEWTFELTLAARDGAPDLDLKLIDTSVVKPDRTLVFASTRAPGLGS
jgi:hypothetical protein